MYIVDRIEGEFAVCETPDEEIVNIPLSAFSSPVREGDVLTLADGVWQIDYEQTKIRKDRIAQKMRRLFQKNQ